MPPLGKLPQAKFREGENYFFWWGGDTLRNVIYVGNFVSGKIAPSFFVGPVLFCCFFGWKFSWQLGYFWNQKKYLNKSTMSMIFLYIYGTLNLKKTT